MEVELCALAGRIAKETERTEEEIQQQLSKLGKNWVSTVGDWYLLNAERRMELELPLLLNSVIDNIVANVAAEADQGSPDCEEREVIVEERTSSSIRLRVANSATCSDLSFNDSVGSALRVLFPGCSQCSIFDGSGKECNLASTVLDSLVEGSEVTWVDPDGVRFRGKLTVTYKLTSKLLSTIAERISLTLAAVDRWLAANDLARFSNRFYGAGLQDFLMLPLVRGPAFCELLDDEESAATISGLVQDIIRLDQYELAAQWIEYLGVTEVSQSALKDHLAKEEIAFDHLLGCDEFDLLALRFSAPVIDQLAPALHEYREFSSVEATYKWLTENGLGIYAVQFAKSNIPFYILPLVNYFVVYEMGIVIDDQRLYKRLKELRNSPAFNAQAVSLWLRDMRLGSLQSSFATLDWNSLEDFSQLPLQDMLNCELVPRDRDSLESGLQELKQFLSFRDCTTSLLEQLGMDRYSELFALHGVSVQMLPYLTDLHLECMGVHSSAERQRTLSVIASLGHALKGVEAETRPQVMLRNLQLPSSAGSHVASSLTGWHQRPTARISSPTTPGIGDTKTVDEWLRFINGPEPSPGKKKRKRKKKKKKKKKAGSSELQTAAEVAASETVGAVESQCAEKDSDAPTAEPQIVSSVVEASDQVTEDESSKADTSQSGAPGDLPSTKAKALATEETLLLGIAMEEASELDPSPEWSGEPLTFETSHLSGLEPAKPARLDPFSPELIPLEEMLQNDEFSDEDDMDPELKAQLDAEVEDFRRRLESTHSKSKLTPIFFLPD